jgi:hypothetical protein
VQRIQEPLQQLLAQFHRPWFFAARRLSEGTGTLASDELMQKVDFLANQSAGKLAASLGMALPPQRLLLAAIQVGFTTC